MFKKAKYLYALLGIGAAVSMSSPAFAAGFGLPQPGDQNLSGNNNAVGVVNNLAGSVINIVFLIAGILAVLYLLWSGIQYITAGGNPDKVKAARQGIINAVIGIVVIMAAFFIIRIATSTRGVFDKNGDIGTGAGGGTGSVGQ
jgi:hypothetical protein